MTSFPKGWFFIKNRINNYVLSTEKPSAGEPVIISTLRSNDIDSQLWQYGEDGRLHNKKTGFVLDVAKGDAKNGIDIVQQNESESSQYQTFALSSDGHIYLKNSPNLVLGIKESFFTRREGQHVHLQVMEKKTDEKKEQQWDFTLPSQRPSSVSSSMHSIKRTISGASIGGFSSSSSSSQVNEGASLVQDIDTSARLLLQGNSVLIRSESNGLFISVDSSAANSSGARIVLESIRANNLESQLWHLDALTGRLINKYSGFALTAEDLTEESFICQSSSLTETDLPTQSWNLENSGVIMLKQNGFVLGLKKDWLGLSREGSPLVLQKITGKLQPHQKFSFATPTFKKQTTLVKSITEFKGEFPEGVFFLKNKRHGLVITVEETEKLAARVIAAPIDMKNYKKQLWKHENGFLVNQASNMVLDVRGGCIVSGSELCQYKLKQTGFENQQWEASIDGYIQCKSHKNVVLAISDHTKKEYPVLLANKKTPDHEEQRWIFVIPRFEHKATTVTETTVEKTVYYHQHAKYPSGWFFISSNVGGAVSSTPFVLTADVSSHDLFLTPINKESWQQQLWMYWYGVLINFGTQMAIDVKTISSGAPIYQELRDAHCSRQRLNLTIEGYIIHGSNASLSLVPQAIPNEKDKYKVVLTDFMASEKSHRWCLLTPSISVTKGVQVLSSWSLARLTELSSSKTNSYQEYAPVAAEWPEETFFITGQNGYALAPEKSEAFSFVVYKQFDNASSEQFKWTYREGYLVHVATNLVLHASDDLIGGSRLQLREKLSYGSNSIDRRQKWCVKTDGSIVSEFKANLGFALVQKNDLLYLELSYASSTGQHYNWAFSRGHYECRYSEIYKKNVFVVVRTEKILLTVKSKKATSSNMVLSTFSTGVFPENWFFITARGDKSLVVTAVTKDEGVKLQIRKFDAKKFRTQLWHAQEGGSLVNLATGFVIDVAGGALIDGSNIIQWHEKYLRIARKNQEWNLSVDGRIYSRYRPGLVIGLKNNKVEEGAELQLQKKGSSDESQLWQFAVPHIKKISSETNESSLSYVSNYLQSVESVEEVDDVSIETTSVERYQRDQKLVAVQQWGVFPTGGFFLYATHDDSKLVITVDKKQRISENGRIEYEVLLRPLNYKEYTWSLWFYKEGHLINAQTGFALDASPTKGALVEDGLRNPLFVREKNMSSFQFWSLSNKGELHLRSDKHLVIGVADISRIGVSGAQVGIKEVRVRKYINEQNVQETVIKSESWLRWSLSTPVYAHKSETTSVTETTSSTTKTSVTEESSSTSGLVAAGAVLESVKEEDINVVSKEESAEDSSDDSDSSSDESDNESSGSKVKTSVVDKLNLAGNLGIATAGAGILAGTAGAAGAISNVITSAPEKLTSIVKGGSSSTEETVKHTITKKTSYKSLKNDRKDSFHLEADYVPTGYEKIVRFKTHQQPNFPTSGYFMIKSHLHGFVLDIANGQPKDGAFVVLAPIKSTDFSSQLWFYDNGQIVNLKSHNLVLDASMTDVVTAGERLCISVKKAAVTSPDQHWEFGTEGGLILLKSRRNFVLGVKELNRVTSSNATIDVYIQEEKTHLKSNFARPEQRWEIKVPALIPVEQTSKATEESKYTVIENGKISCISSSVTALVAFEWVKHTFQHKVTIDNQWPSSQNWFFVRVGNENAFLSAGTSDSSEVKFVSLKEKEDYKQFLWVYINGYLVNYKYMLRLSYDSESKKLLLSKDNKTLDQKFAISSSGNLSLKLNSETIYFHVASEGKHVEGHSYEFNVSTKESSTEEHSLQLHIPVFSDAKIDKESKIALTTASSWVMVSQSSSSVIKETTTTSTKTETISQQYGVFPAGTWFFIKAISKGDSSLVLAVKDSSQKSGASLVLKKLNFKDYRSQLWTFRDGLLFNYGSKYVIDVSGEINALSRLVQSAEAGVSTQKWSLTTSGTIHLGSYSQYSFGYTGSETLKEDLEIVLVDTQNSSSQVISWRFSVPIFGKETVGSTTSSVTTSTTTTTTTTTTVSAIERLTACIEAGAVIESVEEADIRVEDISVKKTDVDNSSKTSTTHVAKESQHKFQDMLTSVGIAVAAGAVAIGAVEGASKIAEKLSEKHEDKKTQVVQAETSKSDTISSVSSSEKEQSTSSSISSSKATSVAHETTNVASAVTDVDKVTETVVVRRTQTTSVQIIEESRTIVRAWKLVFAQRVHRCKSKVELVQVIEESREELFRRLDEHLRVHASIEHLVSGAVPEWHVSIQQVKEIYRARIFEKFLDRLKSEEVTSAEQLDFESVLKSSSEEVESHYKLAIDQQSKIVSETKSSSTEVSEEKSIHENVVLAIADIKTTVRYWLIELYESITIARSKGSSEEEIKVIIEDHRKKLSSQLTEIKKTTSEHLEKTSSTHLSFKKTSINSSIETAIKQTESIVSKQVSWIVSNEKTTVSKEEWTNISRITDEKLSTELKVYQTAVIQEVSQVQKTETSKSDQAEISVVLDEKMIDVAKQTITNKLVETQTKISTWFTELVQQLSCLKEESQSSLSDTKQNALTIVDAAQVEIVTRIEEAKLVLRTYYAHLTYLSWAERRSMEYSLEEIKASIITNISHFKKSLLQDEETTFEKISTLSSISFGAVASRIVVADFQSIVVKVSNYKETKTVVNKTNEIEAEKTKASLQGESSTISGGSKVVGVEIIKSTNDEVTKVEGVAKVSVGESSKIVDKVEAEVEQTKVTKVENKQSSETSTSDTHKESSSSISNKLTAGIIGAAAAVVAGGAAIVHHAESKDSKSQEKVSKSSSEVSTAVIEKPVQTTVTVESDSKVTKIEHEASSTVTKQDKSETLIVAYDQVQVTVHEWLEVLSKRVYECAQKKGASTQEEIDSIVYESQQKLMTEIEKAKRNTTSVIGTSQTTFHDTLAWVRSTVWKQVYEIKQIGYEVASSTETNTTKYEEKLENIKKSTFEKVDSAIEKSKVSASVIHVAHGSSAVITEGKKFEGVDYSKTSYGESVESTKVAVGVFIEETRISIQQIFSQLTTAITERRKQGGSNVKEDVDVIIKKHNDLITEYITKSKSEFEKRISSIHQVTTTSSETTKVQEALSIEVTKKFNSTLDQIHQSISSQVTKVQEVNSSTTISTETEYEEKVSSISTETSKKLDATLYVSESVIGHHIEVVAESTATHHQVSSVAKTETSQKSEESSSTTQVSLGAEFGLLIISETTKKVSEQISTLIEQVHHRVTVGSSTLETDVKEYVSVSEKELDLILDQAKQKVTYELSMVATHEKIEEEKFIESLEAIRHSAKTHICKVQVAASSRKEETKVVSEKLLQIAEESRHEVSSHYHAIKQAAIDLETKFSQAKHTSGEVSIGSSLVVKQKPETVVHVEIKEDDAIVVGEQEIEFDRKESTSTVQKQEQVVKKTEKVEEKKKTSSIDNIVKGALAAGVAVAGAAAVIHKKNEKEELEKAKKQEIEKAKKQEIEKAKKEEIEKAKKQEVFTAYQRLTFDSGVTTIENVNTTFSLWFTSLVQKVSAATKSGASSQKITVIVEESRTELNQIIEYTKFHGSKFCVSATDEKEFISKIEWAASLAHNQATQIQQIGINASSSRTDMSSQMTALATASYHQIEVTLQQLKTTVKFHEKVNKVTSGKSKVDVIETSHVVEKPVAKPVTKVETTVEKTKVAYTVLQETRVTTVALFVTLSERIITRIRQGGSNVEEDVSKMIENTEKEVSKAFTEAKSTTSKVDKKTRLEIEEALTSVHKSVQEQITEVKKVTVGAISSGTTDTKIVVDQVLEVSKTSKTKIESSFTTVSESIAAGLIVVTKTAQQASETVQSWFTDLTSKITKLLEASDCSEEEKQTKVNIMIAEAEVEMKTKIEKLQQTTATTTTTTTTQKTSEITAEHHLDIFFGNIKHTVESQLDVVKNAVKDTSKTDKSKIVATLQSTESQLKQQVSTHCEAIEKVTNVEKITGKEQKVTTEVEESRLDKYKDTIVKTAAGAAAVATAAAIAIDYHKKNQNTQTTAVQVVRETSIKDVQAKIDNWFSRLTERVTKCTKKQESDVSVQVEKIVAEAQSELDVLISVAKSQHITEVTTTENKRTFEETLEYIKKTAYTQSSQITQIVKQSSSSSIDLTTQVEHHVSVVKQQVYSALEVHYQHKDSTVVVEETKKTQAEGSQVTDKKETTVIENKVQVVTETKEQTQKRFTLETTVIVQETKTRMTNYLVLLLDSITSIIHGNSETIRQDIFKRLDKANNEIDVLIKEVKEKYTNVSKESAKYHVEVETQVLVVNSIKQTLDCIESIRTTLLTQLTILREVINRIEVEDIDIITERLEAIITRTRTRIYHTLEIGIELAISSAFEGKVVTWSETVEIPSSFKKVRAVAFDILGSVANYHKTLYKVWKEIITPKNDIVLSSLEFNAFVEDWYGAYTEIKRDNFSKKRPVSDDITLHEALVHILKRYYVKDNFSESEIEELCNAWRKIGVYDDAVIGIRRLKNQASAKYTTVAISDTLSTRSMIELAQNNHLCWHAQFAADMFTSTTTTDASQSVIKGTIQLLGLEHASQLAVVSSSASLLTEAKKQGCHAIQISREEYSKTVTHEETTKTTEVDIKVDGIDILGESIQSYLEHETMVEVWTEKSAPIAPPLLVQKVYFASV